LKGQKSKGEELLRKDFLSLGDVQHWNLITKDILTKAFPPESDLIDSILYAGKDRVFSMFEPESILEKHRRKNFQISLNRLKDFIDHLEFGKEFPKKDTRKEIESTKASESPKISLIPDLDEEKELELDEEGFKEDESERMESLEEPEIPKVSVVPSQEEEAMAIELEKELSEPEIRKRIESMEAPAAGKVSIALGQEEEKRKLESLKELSKPDISKRIESMETSGRGRVYIDPGREEEKRKLESQKESFKPDISKRIERMETSGSRKVFMVHGQDEEKKEAVISLLTKLELEPVILHEQLGQGMTLTEKFEHYADVSFAVIILTGDDYGYPKGKPEESKPRPRQNVVFELGFLMGRFKRNCVCALHEEGLELPSEYQGAVFIPYDAGGLWKLLMARAMKVANVPIDLNKAV
jgi:predicted nucleotide-binding protein